MVRPIRTLDEGAQRIGEGDLDQQIVVRTGDELEGLADHFNRMTAQLRESYAGLERKVEERTHELTNSLEQQTAISEILRVISSSPTDVQPVLRAVAERAAHLCDAPFARVLLIDGDVLRPMARAFEPARRRAAADAVVPLERTSITGRAVHRPGDACTIADIVPLLDAEFPDARDNMRRFGCRAVLAVPADARGRRVRRDLPVPPRAGPVLARPGRARADVRAAGRDRDRQRAPVQRDEGGARAADRDRPKC